MAPAVAMAKAKIISSGDEPSTKRRRVSKTLSEASTASTCEDVPLALACACCSLLIEDCRDVFAPSTPLGSSTPGYATPIPSESSDESKSTHAPDEATSSTGDHGRSKEQVEMHPCSDLFANLETMQGPCCIKCKLPVHPSDAQVYVKASKNADGKFKCNKCGALMKMMSRKLDAYGQTCFDNMKPEAVTKFFRDALTLCSEDNRFKFGLVRGLLKEQLVTEEISVRRSKVATVFKPLSVWEKKGYDVELIKAYNVTEENPACGLTYACPQRTDEREAIEQEIERTLQDAERRVAAKKGDSAVPDWETDFASEAVQGQQMPVPGETAAAAAKRMAKEKKELEKKEAAARKQEEAAAEKLRKDNLAKNQKTCTMATRVIGALDPLNKTIKEAVAHKEFAHCPDVVKSRILKYKDEVADHVSEAQDRLKKQTKANKAGDVLDDLALDSNDLKKLSSDIRGALSNWSTIQKMSLSCK